MKLEIIEVKGVPTCVSSSSECTGDFEDSTLSYTSLGDRIQNAHFNGVPLDNASVVSAYDTDSTIDPLSDIRVSRFDNEERNILKSEVARLRKASNSDVSESAATSESVISPEESNGKS